MWKLLLVVTLVAFPVGQKATSRSKETSVVFWTGNSLNEHENSTVAFDQAEAMGYIIGVSDALSGEGLICSSEHVTVGQTQAVVSKWLQEHPADWHLSAESLVKNALVDAFPCK
jgi:hypothetical protein